MDIGSGELLVILVVLLIVLAPTKVPKLARSIGEAMAELRKARDEPAGAASARVDGPSAPDGGVGLSEDLGDLTPIDVTGE